MPYVALPHADQATRQALGDLRWSRMAAAKPELHAAITLQRKLIGHVDALAARFEQLGAPKLTLPPRYLTTKLGSGIPALTAEPIRMPLELLGSTFVDLCRTLAEGGGGESTAKISRVAESGQLDIRAVVTLALRREQGAMRVAATKGGLGHELLWLVADLCVSPYAHALLRALFDEAPEPLRTALNGWTRGYCALCGSWPTLVERVNGARRLRCSLCAAAWEVADGSCLYCGEHGEAFTVTTPDPSVERTLDTCRTCKGYAKTLGTETSLPFPLVPQADLDSMDLDLAAMQAGFSKPALKQFGARR